MRDRSLELTSGNHALVAARYSTTAVTISGEGRDDREKKIGGGLLRRERRARSRYEWEGPKGRSSKRIEKEGEKAKGVKVEERNDW